VLLCSLLLLSSRASAPVLALSYTHVPAAPANFSIFFPFFVVLLLAFKEIHDPISLTQVAEGDTRTNLSPFSFLAPFPHERFFSPHFPFFIFFSFLSFFFSSGADPCNLYVNELPDDADELFLYRTFAPFGAISSVISFFRFLFLFLLIFFLYRTLALLAPYLRY
jgi:hypothetical protein